MRLLFPVLKSRYKNDVALRRLAGPNLHEGFGDIPLASGFPYVEVTAESNEPLMTFGLDSHLLSVVFKVYTHTSWVRKCNLILENLRRVFHTMTVSTGRIRIWQFELSNESHAVVVDGTRQADQTYNAAYQMTSLQPLIRGT